MAKKGNRVDPRAKVVALVSLLAVIAIATVVPGSVYATTALSGNGHNLVLTNQSAVDYAYGQGNGSYHALALASLNGTATITPSYSVTTGSGNNTTSYTVNPTTIVLETNLTVANLNSYSVTQFVSNITGVSNLSTVTLEYGTASGTTVSLTPMVLGNLTGNSTVGESATMNLLPEMLTGNQSDNVFVVLNFSSAPTVGFSVTNYVYGHSSAANLYVIGEDIGYVAGGIVLGIMTVLVLPFGEIRFSAIKQIPFAPKKSR